MTAILVLTPAALAAAERVRAALPGARLHGLEGRVDGADVGFTDTARHLRELFAAGTPIVALCAAGILIRALAPLLADKKTEPPVLAVAPDCSAVVPLLGGHHGANALARTLAAALGCPASITTAGDLALGVALDEPPPGWRVANPEAAKAVAATLLAGDKVRLEVEAGDANWLAGIPGLEAAEPPTGPLRARGASAERKPSEGSERPAPEGKTQPRQSPAAVVAVRITDHAVQPDDGELVLHPPVLALGVGCERGTPPEALAALVAEVLDGQALAPGAVACVASLDLKADEPAVHELARSLGVPARFFSAAELEREAPRLATPSEVVFRATGCHGIAEGAALAAAGAESSLVVAKVKGERCTVAVARAAAAIDPLAVGQARGKLLVVGIGPGAEYWRTPEASAAIAAASDLVGYGLYLDLLGPAAAGKRRHESGLGAETERARLALDLAAEGRTVALVCSGDAGIYALATLVFELMDRERCPEWLRLDVQVVPGVSALQAAAARAGAPVNHDFCTISLSDLLTPWPTIERRLQAAAAADFVVCFYNPVSQRRQDQLVRARDILLTGRPADTPVVLARQLGRPGETVEVIGLGELTAERADMLTMVVVGNSETRRFTAAGRERVYTPRGYAKKL